MQKILSARERLIVYLTVFTVIFSIGFKFLLAPVINKNDDLNKEIAQVEAKLKKSLLLIQNKEQIEGRYNKLFSNLAAANQKEDAGLNILSTLENVAKASGVLIIDIRPQAPKGSDLYQETQIELRTEGTIDNYLKFIYTLENSPLLLSIKKIQLNAKANTANLEGIFSITHISVTE